MRTTLCAVGTVAVLVSAVGPAAAVERPEYQMPFACGERWEGSTRSTHSPSSLSVDWNRDAYDSGQPVVASAPGVVTDVVNLGDRSYGLYVIVDHGGGWSTLHAHLLSSFVVEGQRVDQGQTIALLGTSGGSTGPHLHYEQRLDRENRHATFDDTPFVYNSWLTSQNCLDVPIVGDWNGDRLTDVGVFVRRATEARFRERMPGGGRTRFSFGSPTDQPVVGDWNGDGLFDAGVWSPAGHTFTLARGDTRRRFSFGDSDDQPISGDWNGDGRWDVGVFDAKSATFFLRNANGNFSTKAFGTASSLPVTGDWNGDGRWDVGVYDPATRTFSLLLPGGQTRRIVYGTATSIPVVGFWNTDARSDVGVWDMRTATFSKRIGPHVTKTIKFGHIR